ncbi:cupredoxin domain-containing protein [Aureimonas psammosilenae]|uniref:cupredoxin domain-containing protein n=1 Tax=Aureimonas psammosilenae TaxID=2495496 RepID=UPI001260CED6|nr:cupredoxin family protein [Aureimonas psammosilenae]
MKKLHIAVAAAATAVAVIAAGPALASGSHAGGHDELAVGKPGGKGANARIVKITMKETEDGKMLFQPAKLQVRQGETLRLQFTNAGQNAHEFVMDESKTLAEHKEVMQKFPEMEHDDPNAIRLEPGAKGEIVWTFSKAGNFEFACLIPGHYEAGMHGPLVVMK